MVRVAWAAPCEIPAVLAIVVSAAQPLAADEVVRARISATSAAGFRFLSLYEEGRAGLPRGYCRLPRCGRDGPMSPALWSGHNEH